MARPISADVSAGASFIPSPTIITLPRDFNLSTSAAFPSGSTPATTSSTPACAPIALAVFSLSPVSMTTCMPISLSRLMASGLSVFITSATAIIPSTLSSSAKNSAVFPFEEKSSAFAISSPKAFFAALSAVFLSSDSINPAFPPYSLRLLRVPASPFPGTALKSSMPPSSFALPSRTSSLSTPASTALANGCSLLLSSA